MRIYTKTGDGGQTGLIGGDRVEKDDPVIEVVGALDELNSAVGLARAHWPDWELAPLLERCQNAVFDIGAEIATPEESKFDYRAEVGSLTEALEASIDELDGRLPRLANFILPSGTIHAAQLHAARTACRRAERRMVALGKARPIRAELLAFLNRLSDWMFVASRAANAQKGVTETVWKKEGA